MVFASVVLHNIFLRAMTGKWKKNKDYRGVFAALLTDLYKTFDYVSHELLIAKLQAYGFHIDALEIVHDYLSNRTQRVKVNNVCSFWKDIFYGVPLRSTLVPLLFDIYDLFYFLENLNIESYADDTTIYIDNETKESVIGVLETSSSLLFGWFNSNFIKVSNDKKPSYK